MYMIIIKSVDFIDVNRSGKQVPCERYVFHLFTSSRSVKLSHTADLSWHHSLVSALSSTPLLPQPVKFPSCKQYV